MGPEAALICRVLDPANHGGVVVLGWGTEAAPWFIGGTLSMLDCSTLRFGLVQIRVCDVQWWRPHAS